MVEAFDEKYKPFLEERKAAMSSLPADESGNAQSLIGFAEQAYSKQIPEPKIPNELVPAFGRYNELKSKDNRAVGRMFGQEGLTPEENQEYKALQEQFKPFLEQRAATHYTNEALVSVQRTIEDKLQKESTASGLSSTRTLAQRAIGVPDNPVVNTLIDIYDIPRNMIWGLLDTGLKMVPEGIERQADALQPLMQKSQDMFGLAGALIPHNLVTAYASLDPRVRYKVKENFLVGFNNMTSGALQTAASYFFTSGHALQFGAKLLALENVLPASKKFVEAAFDRRISYGELDAASNRVANALLKLGIKKGTHAAILLSHSPEWVINYFGVIKGGGIAVLLNTALKATELDSLLRDSDSEILMTEKRFSQMLPPVLPQIPLLKHVIEVDSGSYAKMVSKAASVSPAIDLKGEDEATVFYTSGVLGKQKGVVHTHASLMGTPPIVSAGIQRKREDVIIDLVPFTYLYGLFEVLFGSIITGATVVLVPNFTPRAVLETVEREKGTVIFGVPAMYNALAMVRDEVLARYDLSSLRLVVTAGAKSFPKLMKTLEDKFGLSVYEVYGLTV